jgi:hypothetical protein
VYDIERHSSPEQVNNCIRQLRTLQPGDWPEVLDCDGDLQAKYRIRYVAPGDARATGLQAGSVSFIVSTSTLEHIPLPDVRGIVAECSRIAAPGAIMSHVIDYKDHYSYSDSSIGMFNFYRYNSRAWRWWSPPNNNQNRLRHSEFVDIFRSHGLIDAGVVPHHAEPGTLRDLKLAPEFERYSPDDLLIHSAYFVLRRP